MIHQVSTYGLVSLAAALVNLAFGYIVFKKRPRHPLNQVFGLIILTCVIWSFSEFALRSTLDPQVANTIARLAWAPILLSPAMILHIALTMSGPGFRRVERSKEVILAYSVSIFFVVLNLTSDLVIKGAYMQYWGFTGAFGWVFSSVYAPYHMLMVAASLYLLYRRHTSSDNTVERIQIRYVFAGLSFPYVLGSGLQIILPIMGYTPVPIASALTIVMDAFIAYAVLRYKLLVIEPTSEGILKTKPKYSLDAKTCFMPAESSEALDKYVDQILHGRQGLCVTFTNPKDVRSRYGIARTPIIWLTDKQTRHRSVTPNDIEQLTIHLRDFVNNSKDDSVLLLDGFDELIELNGFDRVYGMVKELNEARAGSGKSILIPVNVRDDLKLLRLQLRREDIEREIEFAKTRYHQLIIDGSNFRYIVKDFQKELIELDLKMNKLNQKRKGEDIEIMQ